MENKDALQKLLRMPESSHRLLASIIALVRASVENNARTDQTDAVLAQALSAWKRGDDDCQAQIQLLRAEKNALAPDCAICPNPCARTAEYPISEFLAEDDRLKALKAEMLFDTAENYQLPKDAEIVYRRLFLFGYEKDAEMFANYMNSI